VATDFDNGLPGSDPAAGSLPARPRFGQQVGNAQRSGDRRVVSGPTSTRAAF